MDHLSDNTIPWSLISVALQGNLNREEDAVLQQWIATDVQNRELFMQLKNSWDNDLEDLPAYLQANESVAWNDLRNRLEAPVTRNNGEQAVAMMPRVRKRTARLISLVSVAAMLLLITGAVIWTMKTRSGSKYKTGNGEQQSVALTDGTLINLFPASAMEVPDGYNGSERKVILKNGEAFFEVRHRSEIPFIVDLDIASVKDIGTSFRIRKTHDSIYVAVVTGVVEFRNKADNEVRLLHAGMQITLLARAGNSRPLIVVDSMSRGVDSLRFVNTFLPEVIRRFEAVYKKKIVIADPAIIQKRFTGNLDGLSFESSMDVLYKSLRIVYVRENDIYYLKKE